MTTAQHHVVGNANGTAYYMSRSAEVWKTALQRHSRQRAARATAHPSSAMPSRAASETR